MENYYSRPEVSNSDLSALKKALYGGQDYDPTAAYKFGSLIDAMITEPHLVDEYKLTVGEVQYEKEDFERSRQMRRAYMKDDMCREMLKSSVMQKVMIVEKMDFNYNVPFSLPVRCKWDLWMPGFNWGGDIKSTAATTQKQFEDACYHFDYDRSRWWYMNIAGSKQDVIIGISKVNFKVFKVPVRQGDPFFESGKQKALELAFKYWQLFGELR